MFDQKFGSCAIGLDVGGTKIAAGIVLPETGRVMAKRIMSTAPERGGRPVLEDACALARSLSNEAVSLGLHLLGIGIGVAELVDLEGNVASQHTIAWQGLQVREAFSSLAPAVVESDARAPALGEAVFGAGRAYDPFVYVTVGTGISSCLVQGGIPYAGSRGNALVLASAPITVTCPACGANHDWLLEELASGPGLVARYNAVMAESVESAEEVMHAAEAGGQTAREIVEYAGRALGNGVAFLINVLDPEAVIVGGGLGLAGGLYWDAFVSATRARIYADSARQLAIIPASLGVDAGLVGAAATIFRRADRGANSYGAKSGGRGMTA